MFAPQALCREKTCMFSSTLPEVLLCQGCGEYAKSQGWGPFNISLCRKPRNVETRALFINIKTQFEKYVAKLAPTIDDQILKYSMNFMFQVHSMALNPKLGNRNHGTQRVSQIPLALTLTLDQRLNPIK